MGRRARTHAPRAPAPGAIACALCARSRRIWGNGTARAHACRGRPRRTQSHARCVRMRDSPEHRGGARARMLCAHARARCTGMLRARA
eukprot:3825681-Pleurochrysis_carterae.AAC.1